MVEGYLAHKWGLLDDLAESGFGVNQGLVLYYPFNETGGSVVEDYSENLRHAFVIDADLGHPGKFTSEIGFDTIDSQNAKIDLDYNELEINQANWSISAWFEYPISNEAVDEYALFHSVGYTYPAFLWGSEQFYSLAGIDFRSDFYATTLAGNPENPQWHHLAITSYPDGFKLFINGNEEFEESIFTAGSLGIRTIGNLLSGSSRFSSGLDDFRVYNRTLLDSEVVALYGNGDGDFGTHRYEEFPPVFDNVPVILLPKDAVLHWTLITLTVTPSRISLDIEMKESQIRTIPSLIYFLTIRLWVKRESLKICTGTNYSCNPRRVGKTPTR